MLVIFKSVLSRRLCLVILTVLTIAACAINPVSEEFDFGVMSQAEEIEIGKTLHEQFLQKYHVYNSRELQNYVNRIGQDLATVSHRSHLNYTFTVVDSHELNAFAIPGGFIYVTRGMLAYLNSESELAAVLGHEVGHIAARHGVRKDAAMEIPTFLGQVLFNHIGFGLDRAYSKFMQAKMTRYSHQFEKEADSLAVEYLARAGYAPKSMSNVISIIKNKEQFIEQYASASNHKANLYHGFDSHPDTSERAVLVEKDVQRLMEELPNSRKPGWTAYLEHLEGLVFGPPNGVRIIDGHYLHPPSRSGVKIPENWSVNANGKILQLVAPGEAAVIQVSSRPHIEGTSAKTYLHGLLLSDEFTSEEELQLDGIDGWIATSTKQTAKGEIPIWLATMIVDDIVHIVVGTTSNKRKYSKTIADCIRSAYRLSDADIARTKPRQINLLKVTPGMTYRQVASESPLGQNAERLLRLINGQTDTNATLQVGHFIKIIR